MLAGDDSQVSETRARTSNQRFEKQCRGECFQASVVACFLSALTAQRLGEEQVPMKCSSLKLENHELWLAECEPHKNIPETHGEPLATLRCSAPTSLR